MKNNTDSNSTVYRIPNRQEQTILNRFYNEWGLFEFFSNQKVIIKEDIKENEKELFLISPDVEKILWNTYLHHAGLYLGRLRKKVLPSLQMGWIISSNSIIVFPFIVVNNKAEELVTYGRDVMSESIDSISEQVANENQMVIILNRYKDIIGIGRTNFPAKELQNKGKKIVVKVISDIGKYIREEDSSLGLV